MGGPFLRFHHDLAFAHLALLVEDRDRDLVGRAAYHVGTIGEAFDDPQQIPGRLLPRALWGRWGPLTFPGCRNLGGPFRSFQERASACSRGPATNGASATAKAGGGIG